MLELEVLIRELLAVDGLAPGAVTVCEISALNHEVLDNTVKGRTFISELLLAGG
jgi:hypothetical protein